MTKQKTLYFQQKVNKHTFDFIEMRTKELGLNNKKEYFNRLLIRDGLYKND